MTAAPIAPPANGRVAGDADVARIAGLVGDPTRAAMLVALLDGRPRTAGELGRLGGVAPSTASGHLAQLLEGGLVACEADGRRRLYRLASPETAELLEALARLAPPTRPRSLRGVDRAHALRAARLCYDHLAGVLGVAVTEGLVGRGVLQLAADGSAYASRLTARRGSTGSASTSPPHGCGGDRSHGRASTGASAVPTWRARWAPVWRRFLGHGWVARRPDDRALVVTATGREALWRELAIRLD